MRRFTPLAVGMVVLALTAGCGRPGTRMATRVTEVPRVDLDTSGGNRGYLVGTPPAPGDRKTTRQMVETDIEIPSFYKPKPGRPINPDDLAPERDEPAAMPADRGPVRVGGGGPCEQTYVVQRGDTLGSIAAKPEIYGKASQWRRIFEANRELLGDNPNRLKVGMSLCIPGGDGGEAFEGGGAFTK
jgi:nucleoid-associated protein YgaU